MKSWSQGLFCNVECACVQVLGVECCARLINAALKLQEGKTLTYKDGKEVTLDPTVNSQKVIFKQVITSLFTTMLLFSKVRGN